MELIREIVGNFGPGFTEEDLQILKGAVLRGQALKNETLSAKLGVVQNISYLGYPDDYQARNAARVEAMTLDQFREITGKYLRADAMQYIVVGDAETQAGRLGELGFGEPVMLKSSSGR
jgi:zinc protease